MNEKILDIIVGARPNFVKLASIINASRKMILPFQIRIIHTGQHYDEKMNDIFFKQLDLPKPDVNLNVGSGTSGYQVANIILKYEEVVLQKRPFMILVIGDVNSTVAASIVAKQNLILLGHIEAGIRSFDKEMPEEINRIITDSITDYFYVTTEFAIRNLRNLGIEEENIFHVGNTMIDTLIHSIDQINSVKLEYPKSEYLILTLHRVSNTKNSDKLNKLFKKLIKENININNIKILDPLPYFEFLNLLKNAKCVISDSGGITEEASYLNVPCLTLRNNTERPETIDYGTNILIGDDLDNLDIYINKIKEGEWKKYSGIDKWDNKVGFRILNHIKNAIV
jgi:UDP-N-acetylglucosamine 2-epimerase (non-hydrolysing)